MSISGRNPRWWVLNVVAPTVFAGALVLYVYSRRDELRALDGIPVTEFALVALLTAVGHFLNAEEFGLLYRLMDARVGVNENWMLYSAGQVGNHLPGQIGTLYRFRYLKAVHGLPYAGATAAYSINFVITVFATGLIGVVGCLGLGATEGTWSVVLLAALGGLMAVALVTAVVPISDRERTGRLGDAWSRFGAGWRRARRHPRTSATVLGLEILRYALLAWRLQIAFGWLDVDEPYWFFLVIGPIGALATFVAFTPAGIGIRELAIATATVALDRTFDEGLLGSTADRAISLLVVLAIGIPGTIVSARRLRAASAAEASPTSPASPASPT